MRNPTPEYRAWYGMKTRCTNPNYKSYHSYGGRGIKVCERWSKSFALFLLDVGRKPSPAHSIDRINNDGNYEPGNVRWATKEEQANNTRQAKFITASDETLSISQWARRIGIDRAAMRDRLKHHAPEVAATLPRMVFVPGCRTHRVTRSSTGFKGVYRNNNRFEARIHIDHKVRYLGLFKTAEEAAIAYNRAATEAWGSYAKLNQIPVTA